MFYLIDRIVQMDNEALKKLAEQYRIYVKNNLNAELIAEACERVLELRIKLINIQKVIN